MRLHEFQPKTIKPKTPDQQRIAVMKVTAKRADQAVKTERARQKMVKAQQSMAKARLPIVIA